MSNSSPAPLVRTVGLDLGGRSTACCILTPSGEPELETSVEMNREAVAEFFGSLPACRIVMEATGGTRWVSKLAVDAGHEVLIANPRTFRLIAASQKKSDRNDARTLASFGQVRPELMQPVFLRSDEAEQARQVLKARTLLVGQRTELINVVRSIARNSGKPLPYWSSPSFHRSARKRIEASLLLAVSPLLDQLESLGKAIEHYDEQIDRLSREAFPATEVLRQIPGVGPMTALAFAATVDDPDRFAKLRNVAAYAGLVSKARASGDYNPQLGITKAGDSLLRKLLVNSATYIVGSRAPDSDLKRIADRLCERGGQAARAKARIATARKLSILLMSLLKTGEVYEPLRHSESSVA